MAMKGQIQVQFNWMFVLIVGGLILLFFTNIIIKYQDTSESQTALTVINDLQTIATGAGVSKGTAQVLNKPNVDLLVSCGMDEDCDCNFKMSGNSKRFGDIRLFAPERVTGREMVAWTLDWNCPFRITNFLYLTSPDVMYYLVDITGASQVDDFVNETLPSLLNYKHMGDALDASGPLQDQNDPVIKVVYFGSCPSPGDANNFSGFDMATDDVKGLCIQSSGPLFNKGTLKFYEVDNNWDFIQDGYDINFTGDESMFAAIFAGSYHNYECNMKEAFKRMVTISDIYIERTNTLTCVGGSGTLYDKANETLHALRSNASLLSRRVNGSYSELYDLQENMTFHNSQLQIRSCPSIY